MPRLQKARIGNESRSDESKPWENHKRSGLNHAEVSYREARWRDQTSSVGSQNIPLYRLVTAYVRPFMKWSRKNDNV
jgi:hypothetical protein